MAIPPFLLKEKLVCVEWLDAAMDASADGKRDAFMAIKPCINYTFGVLMGQTKEHLVLGTEVSDWDDTTYRWRMQIPVKMVRRVTRLAWPSRRPRPP